MNSMKNEAPSEVNSWLRMFAMNHIERFPRADWPKAKDGQSFWIGWSRAFAKRGITQAEAEGASIMLMQDPPEYLDHHLSAILRIIEGIRERQTFERSEGRFAAAPKFGDSDPDAVALFKRFIAASGEAKLELLQELEARAADCVPAAEMVRPRVPLESPPRPAEVVKSLRRTRSVG